MSNNASRTPKIRSRSPRRLLEYLLARPVRYALAVVSVAAVAIIALTANGWVSVDAYVFMLFGAMALSGTAAGIGPGLLATVLALVCGWAIPAMEIPSPRLQELAAEGVLVSLLGGALRRAQNRASERLSDNRKLEQQILEISDEERRRIGHDLHDGLGQHLTGISLLSEAMVQQLQSGGTPDPQNIERITYLVSDAVRITRDLAKSLSPVTLERAGFLAAIEELAQTSSALFGINCSCEFASGDVPLHSARALHLFRIVQEAVNNAVRHGRARNVLIACSQTMTDIKVMVTDDGLGLSNKTTTDPGLGLRIMEYRSRILEASLTVERASANGGTIVTCISPIVAGDVASRDHGV